MEPENYGSSSATTQIYRSWSFCLVNFRQYLSFSLSFFILFSFFTMLTKIFVQHPQLGNLNHLLPNEALIRTRNLLKHFQNPSFPCRLNWVTRKHSGCLIPSWNEGRECQLDLPCTLLLRGDSGSGFRWIISHTIISIHLHDTFLRWGLVVIQVSATRSPRKTRQMDIESEGYFKNIQILAPTDRRLRQSTKSVGGLGACPERDDSQALA